MTMLTPPRIRPGTPEERSAFVFTEEFLRLANHHEVINGTTLARLHLELERQHPLAVVEPAEVTPAAPVPAPAPPPRAPQAATWSTPPVVPPRTTPAKPWPQPEKKYVPSPAKTMAAPVTPPAREIMRPQPPEWRRDASRWWERTRETVGSDLAVHGLAYLGVLLLFAGLLGFVIFAYADVSQWARPVAEVAVPATFFLAAWLLSRRGSSLVPRLLVLLGSAVVPIVVITAFVDGAPYPSDLSRGALQWTLGLSLLAIAAVYAVLAERHPTSLIAYLVAPIAWLGTVYLASMTAADWVGGRDDVVTPRSWQMAIVSVVVALTAVLVRLLPERRVVTTTSAVVLPGMLVVDALLLLAAGNEGWPRWPVFVACLAAAVTIEAQARRMPSEWVGLVEIGLVLVGALVVLPEFQLGWWAVGVTATMIAVAEFEGWRRPSPSTTAIALVPAAVTFLLAATVPWPALLAACGVHAYAMTRRHWRVTWMVPAEVLTGVMMVTPLIAALALVQLIEPSVAFVVCGALLLAWALVLDLPVRVDPRWKLWTPIVAVGLLAAPPFLIHDGAWYGTVLIGAALATATLFATPLEVRVRALLVVPAVVWVSALAADWLEIEPTVQVATLAVAGALLVVAVCAHRFVSGEVLHAYGLVAVLAGTGAAAGLGGGPALTVGLTACLVAFLATAVADLVAVSPIGGVVDEVTGARSMEKVSTFAVAVTVPVIVAQVLVDLAGLEILSATVLLAIVVTGLVEVIAGRTLPIPDIPRRTVAVLGLALTAPAVAVTGWWQAALAYLLALAAIAVFEPVQRREWLVWVAWFEGMLATSHMVGHFADEPGSYSVVMLVLGVSMTTAVLAIARVAADRHDEPVRLPRPALRAAAAVGLVATGIACTSAIVAGQGWWGSAAIVLAAATATWAILIRLPYLTIASWPLLGVGVGAVVPWQAVEHPWSLTMWGAATVAAAAVIRRTADRGRLLGLWHLPALGVGLAWSAIGLALVMQDPFGEGTWTLSFMVVAATLLFIAVERAQAWWALGSVVAVDIAAADASLRWLSLALAVEAVALLVAAVKTAPPVRWGLNGASMGCTVGAWVAYLATVDWLFTTRMAVSALVGASIVLIVATVMRLAELEVEWPVPWALAGVVAVSMASFSVHRDVQGWDELARMLVVAWLLVAAGLAVAAARTHVALRYLSFVAVLLAGVLAWVGYEPTATVVVWVATVTGGVMITAALMAWTWHEDSEWAMPFLAFAAVLDLIANGVAMNEMPDRTLLVPVLVVIGLELAIVGVMRPALVGALLLSPIVFLGAWMVFATGAVLGDPQWYTVPIGLVLLVDTGLARRMLPPAMARDHRTELVATEMAGLGFLVGAAIIGALRTEMWNAVVGIGLGVLITAWGALTKVRRRALFGLATVLVSVALLFGIPLGHFVATHDVLTSGTMWLLVAAAGVIALVTAAFLEQGRIKVRAAVRKLHDLTSDWE